MRWPEVLANGVQYNFQIVIVILYRASFQGYRYRDRSPVRNGIPLDLIHWRTIAKDSRAMRIAFRPGGKTIGESLVRGAGISHDEFERSRLVGRHIGSERTIHRGENYPFPLAVPNSQGQDD